MARGGRFDRWTRRPAANTDVFPAVGDDDTGDEDDPDSESEDTDTDLEPRHHDGRWSRIGERLRQLGAVLLAWLARELRRRLPQFGRAVRPRLIRLGASVLAGLLMWSSYPGLNWWWAAILAFVVLSWVLTRPATTPLGGFGYGFLFGLAFYLPLVQWVRLLVGLTPLLALVLVCAVFPGIFGLSAVVVRRLPGWPIWFAVLWAAQEWLKSTVPFGGFPWGVVAAGQTDGPFLPLVRLGSVPLLSLTIALIGCSVTAIVVEVVSWWRLSRQQQTDSPPAVVLPTVCICLVFFATAAIWPQVRHSGTGSGNEPTVTAALVQGNVPRLGLMFNAQRLAVLDNAVRETRQLADDVHAGRVPQPDFVVWAEDASDVDPLRNPDAAQQISTAVEAIGAPILVGTVLEVGGRPPNSPAETNTVIVWNPKTGPGEHYDKRIIQPFGEYLPWRGFFRHLTGLADWAGYIVPGQGTGVVHAAGIPVGVATCWEVIFDRALRESVHNGAQVFAVPANNANFNQTMSEQQLAFSKVRAVELDRYVVVASNVGVSALVTPDGRELVRTSFFEPAYLDGQVRLKTSLTPAARWGPIVQGSLLATAVAVLLAAMLHNGWFTDIYRRLSQLAKNFGRAPKRSDDEPLGDDVVAEDEGGRHSARDGPERGDI